MGVVEAGRERDREREWVTTAGIWNSGNQRGSYLRGGEVGIYSLKAASAAGIP